MLTAVVIAAILSIQLVTVHSDTVQKCLVGANHKKYPSAEPSGFATCFPWQNKSCCSPELTVELKKNGMKNLMHFDWDYCGGLSESCKTYVSNHLCLYYCDPNMVKWHSMGPLVQGVPICSDICDKWFEECKDDRIFTDNWNEYILDYYPQGLVKPDAPCHTFAELFKNGEGLCTKIWGPGYKYERSSNCMVFDFKGENPNDKVVPVAPASSS